MLISKFNFSKLNKIDQAFKKGTRLGLQRTSVDLAGKAGNSSGIIKEEMSQPKTGKKYIISRNGKRRAHIASNANGQESSAILSGKLRKSIRGKVIGSNRAEFSANTPYAKLQEKGGKNSQGKIVAARNNLKRPITAYRRDTINNIDNSIKNCLK